VHPLRSSAFGVQPYQCRTCRPCSIIVRPRRFWLFISVCQQNDDQLAVRDSIEALGKRRSAARCEVLHHLGSQSNREHRVSCCQPKVPQIVAGGRNKHGGLFRHGPRLYRRTRGRGALAGRACSSLKRVRLGAETAIHYSFCGAKGYSARCRVEPLAAKSILGYVQRLGLSEYSTSCRERYLVLSEALARGQTARPKGRFGRFSVK